MTGDARPREAFRHGLFARSPFVVLAALGCAAAALLGLQLLFTSGAFSRVRESVLLRDTRDDFLQDSYVVGRLKRQPPAHLPVYLLGGSATRESLVSEQSFAAVVRQTTGLAVSPYVLCNQNQTFGQSLAIVDNLPPGPGVVVIGINNNRFHFSPAAIAEQAEGDPLLLDSPTLRAFVGESPASSLLPSRLPGILPGIMGYLVSLADTKVTALVQGRPLGLKYDEHWVTASRMWSDARKEQGVQNWISSHGKTFFENSAYNGRLLDVLVGRAQQRGLSVVLVEETENTAIVGHAFDRFKRVYRPIVRSVAAKHHVPYLDLQSKLRLTDADFWDYIHPVEPGRVIWQKVLAKALEPTLRSAADAPAGTSGG